MGLDMYLYVVRYHPTVEMKNGKPVQLDKDHHKKCPSCGKGMPEPPFEKKKTVYEGVYWRKANAIHNWFVKNIQEGNDDCGTYDVGIEQIEMLKRDVDHVLAHPKDASKILPTQDGFFFGDTNYDKYYFDDLKRTSKELETLLKWMKKNKNFQFGEDYYYMQYHSSW